jgi:aminodeoxyfutalosine synthase
VCSRAPSAASRAEKGEAGAFEYSVEDIIGMVSDEVREVHIVGGHHPDWPFEYYERVIAGLHAARPGVQIKAFTAAEIDYFWRRWKVEPREALTRLKAAGLQTMPGGGAEIFSSRLAKELRYAGKADGDRLVRDPRHRPLARHPDQRDHALRPRRDGRRAGSITCCGSAPSRTLRRLPHLHRPAYQVGATQLVPRATPPADNLRTIAAARLLLDNFRTSRRTGCSLGEETASIALHFGADDVNGTLEDERDPALGGRPDPAGLAREQLFRIIRDAARCRCERDALYNVSRSGSARARGVRRASRVGDSTQMIARQGARTASGSIAPRAAGC